jgi:CubicO group peptidase (beta-lactamase class C family)
MRVDEMSGVAVVARGGITVVERVGGLADRDLGVACTARTRFQIASVSKQFTAFAVLLLAAESRLSLDDPVSRWLDGCPQAWKAMRIRHLLTHTAGLGHWADFPGLDLYRPITRAHELDIFRRAPLLSAPGSRYYYSSPGYVLLAWIVEQAYGQPYASFLASAVFGPLGLQQTSAGDPPGGAGMAAGYRSGQLVPSVELATVGLGAGDVWSTAADLLRWDEAVARRELLPAELHEAMFTARPAPGSAGTRGNWSFTGYGYGWRIGAIGGRRAFFHTGDNPGYQSVNAWLPDEQLTLVILTNDEATDVAQAVTGLLELARAAAD